VADTAFQTQYRQEFIAGFEQKPTYFRNAVTTEVVIKGNTATFLVADTGGASAVTRGVNGLIPARADNLTQTSATLAEWHDKPRRTEFNIFASQGDGRRILQRGTQIVMNRKIDDLLIAELSTGSVNRRVRHRLARPLREGQSHPRQVRRGHRGRGQHVLRDLAGSGSLSAAGEGIRIFRLCRREALQRSGDALSPLDGHELLHL
jgi:hypothetical protein